MTVATPGTQPTQGGSSVAGASAKPKLYGLLAEFENPSQIVAAAKKVHAAGYKWFDCCTPFPVHGLDKAMGVKPTILPFLVLGGGITGCILATVLQWFTNATNFDFWALVPVIGYDFPVSGKPMSSIPTWIPVVFELTVLLSAIGCFTFLLILNKLPMLYHPCFKSDRFARVTDDRFFLVIEAKDPQFYLGKTTGFIESLKPASIEELEA